VLRFLRIWLPAIVTLGGVVVMAVGGFGDVALEGGAGIVGAGLSIWLLNVLLRVGLHDDVDRDREDAARDFLDEHGYWPDEAPPGASSAPAPSAPAGTDPERRVSHDRSRFPPRRPG
jgi:hypothetical protein